MTLGMTSPAVSPEGTNLLRLIYVIKNPCTACLRHVLNNHIPNGCTDIKHAVSSNNHKLQPPVLTRKQYCKLFPQGQLCLNFDVSKCDMTLLYALLRNISSMQQPSTGWGNPVSSQPRDTSTEANVERLRVLRNDIIHEDRHEISDSDFNRFWDEIEKCLADIDTSLGNTTSFQQDLVSLKTCNLDPQFIEREFGKMLKKTKENQTKNMAALEELKVTVNKTFDKVSRMEEELHEHNITVDEQNNMIHTKNQHHGCIDGGKGMLDKDIMKEVEEMCKAIDDRSWSIILRKTFAYIKSNLTGNEAAQIANHLLEQQHIKPCQLEEIQNLAEKKNRSYCVDKLLKAIINGDEKHVSYFFWALISVNKRFKKVLKTTVTREDISRFDQVWNTTISTSRSAATKRFDEKDIIFFQEKLSNSQEVVNSINDIMLVRMHFTVRDHTNILECKESDPKIRKLCETMNACNIDVEQELRRDDLLRPSLIEVWMRHKQQRENQDSARYRPWLHATLKLVCFSRTLQFEQAVDGCVILKFSTADDFDTASLTREFVRDTLTDLLWKGYLETQMSITNPVHVTVFIMSPGKNGKDEIQFYIDFDAVDEGTGGEGNEQEMADEERRLLSEQLDLIGLSDWIMENPDVEQITKEMLKDKLSNTDLSRPKERIALLESIYGIRNGQELIKAFIQEEDADVYKNTFVGTEQDSGEKIPSLGKLNFTFEKGGGLQRLYSFRIYMNTDKKDIPMDSPGVIPDEESLTDIPVPEVSDIPRDSPEFIPEKESSKDIPVPEDSVFESELLSERSGYDTMEQRVWQKDGITYIIQMGKLEDIWCDVMIIFGKDRNFLPKTIIEKVGPQIQREFKYKYLSGLKDKEVAVLSGFNLPVWKIFYCDCSWDEIYTCAKNAFQLKMTSILFLVQEESFAETCVDVLNYHRWGSYTIAHKISTLYIHVDQDNFDRKRIMKIIENKAKKVFYEDFYKKSFGRTADSKVFTIGNTPEHSTVTLTIQIGKVEEIKSEAIVIFDVGKGQWPLQILSSDILEKAGPMIQEEFQNKYPAGLEYGEVAVLSGHNLPVKHIIYGVLPRWPVTWLEQVIVVFLSKCFQHISNKGITCIAYWIPRVTYHVAELYISVLRCFMEMQVYGELFSSIPTENKVITDDSTIGQFLITAMEKQWSKRIEFKLGHITLQIKDVLLATRLIGRIHEIQPYAKESKEQGLPKSNALLIISEMENIANVLEEINPSLKSKFTTKAQSALGKKRVIILDGYHQHFDTIICGIWYYMTLEAEITTFILECLQIAENKKMKCISLLFDIDYYRGRIDESMTQNINIGLRIFALETPSSIITRLHCDSTFIAQELSDVTSVKVFKENQLTVVLNAMYSHRDYIFEERYEERSLFRRGQEQLEKVNSVYVICDVSDARWPRDDYHDAFQKIKKRIVKSEVLKFEDVLIQQYYHDDTIGVMYGEAKLDRQAMDKFFYTCMEKADASRIPLVTFLVPESRRYIEKWYLSGPLYSSSDPHLHNIRLFAGRLYTSVKRFAKTMPSSNVKIIVIRHHEYELKFTQQVLEREWREPTEDTEYDPCEEIERKMKDSKMDIERNMKDIERKMTVFMKDWESSTEGESDTSSEYIKKEIPVSDSKPQDTSRKEINTLVQQDWVFEDEWREPTEDTEYDPCEDMERKMKDSEMVIDRNMEDVERKMTAIKEDWGSSSEVPEQQLVEFAAERKKESGRSSAAAKSGTEFNFHSHLHKHEHKNYTQVDDKCTMVTPQVLEEHERLIERSTEDQVD